MVGRAGVFLKMIRQTAPIVYRDFGSILTQPGLGIEVELTESFYERPRIADFSKIGIVGEYGRAFSRQPRR